ncbi:hypothetical protein P7H74_13055 [Enterococcus devriesei]|uniref:hypothetical protein n=1 Tax=Enterococcus TaxID=1350 RepID=UPI001C110FE3|nr:hypothetical protein [Enterococcus devriesei]MBU5365642.1 hypothetical protein [Enterococcus devriesei]MDT2822675.1 hypothetical protein [Enterococcus devriesei]
MEYRYIVQVETLVGERIEEYFKTYREALCCATNYERVKMSKILKLGELVNEFNY